MVPSFVVGALVLRSVHRIIDADVAQVWRAAAARSEALYERRQGRSELLLVRGLEAGYGGRTIIRGIDLDLREGEIVALLGTNGAGKSTLLKSISGVVEADRGAVVLDGRDITHAPPNEIANLGVVQLPGGAGRVRWAHRRREPRRSRSGRDPLGTTRRADEGRERSAGRARDVPRAGPVLGQPCRQPVGWPAADARARDVPREPGRGSCSSTSSRSVWRRWSWPRCSRCCAAWPTTAWRSSSSSRA